MHIYVRWKMNGTVDRLKTQTTDAVQNISFLSIERTFSTQKNSFLF